MKELFYIILGAILSVFLSEEWSRIKKYIHQIFNYLLPFFQNYRKDIRKVKSDIWQVYIEIIYLYLSEDLKSLVNNIQNKKIAYCDEGIFFEYNDEIIIIGQKGEEKAKNNKLFQFTTLDFETNKKLKHLSKFGLFRKINLINQNNVQYFKIEVYPRNTKQIKDLKN